MSERPVDHPRKRELEAMSTNANVHTFLQTATLESSYLLESHMPMSGINEAVILIFSASVFALESIPVIRDDPREIGFHGERVSP